VGVEGVVDEGGSFQQPLVVGLHLAAGRADRAQGRSEGVRVDVGGDVGGVHDARHLDERRVIVEAVVVDEGLEDAPPAAVGLVAVGESLAPSASKSKEQPLESSAVASTRSGGTYRISASGSMNRRISQGQAIPPTLGRCWVTHCMTTPFRGARTVTFV
jgi:hypothetical protein